MRTLVLEVSATGRVAALHSDAFDLGFLGAKTVRRQTDIVFDEPSQTWDIQYIKEDGEHMTHPVLGGFLGYEHARGFEVSWLNRCRMQGINPEHEEGLRTAISLKVMDIAECFAA